MTYYIITEGTPTDYGGRTVRVKIAPDPEQPTDDEVAACWPISTKRVDHYPPRLLVSKSPGKQRPRNASRNRDIQRLYIAGYTAAEIGRLCHLAEASIYYILHAMGTPMRSKGKRVA